MNLRKLLCGLLALCLLLTMAPAALMEAVEAPVEEAGAAIGAEDLVVVSPETPVNPLPAPTRVLLADADNNQLKDTVEVNLSEYKSQDFVVKFVAYEGVFGDKIQWKISNNTVVKATKVSATTYNLRTKKAGKVKITAKDIKSGKSASFTLKVLDDSKKASTVKLVVYDDTRLNDDKDRIYIGEDAVNPLLMYADVKPYKNAYTVTWTVDSMTYAYLLTSAGKSARTLTLSSNEEYVPLFFTGKPGTVKITAKVGSHKATLKLKVTTKKNGIKIVNAYTPTTIPLWSYNTKAKGDFAFEKTSIKLEADNYYSDAPLNVRNSFVWKSSKKAVAKVAKSTPAGFGKVTAVKKGTTIISVEKDDYAPAKLSLTVEDNGPTDVYFMDGLYNPFNEEVEVPEITLYKGQTARLIDMVAVDLPNDEGDPVTDNIWNNIGSKKKGAFLFTKKGHNCVDLLNKYNGTVKATKVSDDPQYIWVETFNGKTAYLKIKVKD